MQEFPDHDKTHAAYFQMGDWGHIQFIDLRTMTKAGNECPRSVTYPQQDQNQLDGNDRVSVVCVRNLWKSEAMNVNLHVKVVCEESSKRWTKTQLAKRLPTGTGSTSLLAFEVCKILVRSMILVGHIGTCLTVTASPVQLNLWRKYFLLYAI